MKKVAVITGGASGIGKAISFAFAKEDYQVFIIDKDLNKLSSALSSDFKNLPVESYCGDVSDSKDVNAAFEKCFEQFQRVDVLVSCAAIMRKAPFLELSETDWNESIQVNLNGVFLCGQKAAQWMVQNNAKGSIINIACIRSEIATTNFSAYIASKGAVKSLTKAMAVDLAPYGINVNAIAPGQTYTEATREFLKDDEKRKRIESTIPLARLGEPEDIANVAVFLASDKARSMTGSVIPVDGGYLSYKE
jgi:NAD(P)-dependent dehydrogenase (short-subunit alcohol dehydrogenase family)